MDAQPVQKGHAEVGVLQRSRSVEQVCWWRCSRVPGGVRAARLQVIFLAASTARRDGERRYAYAPHFCVDSQHCTYWFFHLDNQKNEELDLLV